MSPEDKAIYPPQPASVGWRGRCPRCGEGRLFDGFLTVAPRCANCGLDFSFADSGDGPAVFIMMIVSYDEYLEATYRLTPLAQANWLLSPSTPRDLARRRDVALQQTKRWSYVCLAGLAIAGMGAAYEWCRRHPPALSAPP